MVLPSRQGKKGWGPSTNGTYKFRTNSFPEEKPLLMLTTGSPQSKDHV